MILSYQRFETCMWALHTVVQRTRYLPSISSNFCQATSSEQTIRVSCRLKRQGSEKRVENETSASFVLQLNATGLLGGFTNTLIMIVPGSTAALVDRIFFCWGGADLRRTHAPMSLLGCYQWTGDLITCLIWMQHCSQSSNNKIFNSFNSTTYHRTVKIRLSNILVVVYPCKLTTKGLWGVKMLSYFQVVLTSKRKASQSWSGLMESGILMLSFLFQRKVVTAFSYCLQLKTKSKFTEYTSSLLVL